MSHTKLDKEFCDLFDSACARVGIKAFRSEFETISLPPWKNIRDQMNRSSAMFLLVGKELVKMQDKSSKDAKTARDWKYTQNWIAYEIDLACQRDIDVWVLCEDIPINFPVPYFNHYQPFATGRDWLRRVLEMYVEGEGNRISVALATSLQVLGSKVMWMSCPNDQCKIQFYFWAYPHPRPFAVPCPQCLKILEFG